MGTPQVQSYQKLAAAFPEAWNDYLLRHPALQEELIKSFGWVNRAREVEVGARQDKLELFEAILGLGGLPPVPPEARGRYQKRLREIMRRASRELQKYRNSLRPKARMRQERRHLRG
jgi:hypothetical protein